MVLQQDKDFVLHEMREPKPASVEINEWISRQKAINEEIEWTEEITGTQFSKFYFFSRTKESINNWKLELEQLKNEIPFTKTLTSTHNTEVMVANVSKASGIVQMLERFDLTGCETLATRDSDNDLEMFELASQ